MKNLRWVILAFVAVMSVQIVVPQTGITKLDQRVNDFTNTLSFQEWQEIDRLLKSYEDTASTQVVVLIVNSLGGESIEGYADKKFQENMIGQAFKNQGVLLLIAKQDKKIRIEAGQGLDGVLTNAVSSQIIKNEIRPYLEADNYLGGIVTGVDAIVRATVGDYSLDDHDNTTLLVVIIVAAILLIIAAFIFRKRCKSK